MRFPCVYPGQHTRIDGSMLTGPALSEPLAEADPAVDAQLRAELAASVAPFRAVRTAAEGGFPDDQMLAAGDKDGDALIMGGADALVTQIASIERAATALGPGDVALEGPDSLDAPRAIFR
jgi:putative iron-regulated protein